MSFNWASLYLDNSTIQGAYIETSKYSTAIQIPFHPIPLFAPKLFRDIPTLTKLFAAQTAVPNIPVIAATSAQHILDNKKKLEMKCEVRN